MAYIGTQGWEAFSDASWIAKLLAVKNAAKLSIVAPRPGGSVRALRCTTTKSGATVTAGLVNVCPLAKIAANDWATGVIGFGWKPGAAATYVPLVLTNASGGVLLSVHWDGAHFAVGNWKDSMSTLDANWGLTAAPTLNVAGTIDASARDWYWIELKFDTSASSGSYALRINMASALTYSGAVSPSGFGVWDPGNGPAPPGANTGFNVSKAIVGTCTCAVDGDLYSDHDDAYFLDMNSGLNDFLGLRYVLPFNPVSDSTVQMAPTPSNAPNHAGLMGVLDGAHYVTTSTNNHLELFLCNAPPATSVLDGVQLTYFIKQSGGSHNVTGAVRTAAGATALPCAVNTATVTADYVGYMDALAKNPSNGDWGTGYPTGIGVKYVP